MQGITDLESLVSQVESIRKNQPDTQQILGDIPPIQLAASQTLINIGEISSAKALSEISSADKKLGNSMYKSLAGQSKGVFVPRDEIGVSKKGENTKEALNFVEFLISNEMQSLSQGMGLPVNCMAIKNVLNDETQGALIETIGGNLGEDLFLLDVKWPQKEELMEFESLISSLNTRSETDGVLRETVLKYAEECLTGKLSVQEASKNVVQKVNLYLSE